MEGSNLSLHYPDTHTKSKIIDTDLCLVMRTLCCTWNIIFTLFFQTEISTTGCWRLKSALHHEWTHLLVHPPSALKHTSSQLNTWKRLCSVRSLSNKTLIYTVTRTSALFSQPSCPHIQSDTQLTKKKTPTNSPTQKSQYVMFRTV